MSIRFKEPIAWFYGETYESRRNRIVPIVGAIVCVVLEAIAFFYHVYLPDLFIALVFTFASVFVLFQCIRITMLVGEARIQNYLYTPGDHSYNMSIWALPVIIAAMIPWCILLIYPVRPQDRYHQIIAVGVNVMLIGINKYHIWEAVRLERHTAAAWDNGGMMRRGSVNILNGDLPFPPRPPRHTPVVVQTPAGGAPAIGSVISPDNQ